MPLSIKDQHGWVKIIQTKTVQAFANHAGSIGLKLRVKLHKKELLRTGKRLRSRVAKRTQRISRIRARLFGSGIRKTGLMQAGPIFYRANAPAAL